MKRIIFAIIAVVILAGSAFASGDYLEKKTLVLPIGTSISTAAQPGVSPKITVPQSIKVVDIEVYSGVGISASSTDYAVFHLYDDGSSVANFTSSGTALVADTPTSMSTPTNASPLSVAKDSLIQAKCLKVGTGVAIASPAFLILHYYNAE